MYGYLRIERNIELFAVEYDMVLNMVLERLHGFLE
jgi:hypothetical protein